MYGVTSLLRNYNISIREGSSKFFTRDIFSTCLLIYTHSHTHTCKYKYIPMYIFFILDSGMKANPTTIKEKTVLSLLMSKTNGPGMTFLVTSRQEGFVSYLEQPSARSLQKSPGDGDRKEEPIQPGQRVPAPREERQCAEKTEPFSVTMALFIFILFVWDNVFWCGLGAGVIFSVRIHSH